MAFDDPNEQPGQILIYENGAANVQVRLEGQTVWLSQRLLAELYQVSVPTINEHLAGIYTDGELSPETTIRSFRIVQREGSRDVSRTVEHYNLDTILAVGYRVRSHRGTAFRQWATARLSELLAKGFTLDDERLKAGRTLGTDYFDELLERIRDIRASERLFYQKITDIYATSIDYDPRHELSQNFFATVQNKLHWAVHGHTAAELVKLRAAMPHSPTWAWRRGRTPPMAPSAKSTSPSPKTTWVKKNCANSTASSPCIWTSPKTRRAAERPCTWRTGSHGWTPFWNSMSATCSPMRARFRMRWPSGTPMPNSRSTTPNAAVWKRKRAATLIARWMR